MPKRPSDERGGGRSAKLPTGARRRRHLYLVLDDWELGYSIRKIDLSSETDSGDAEEPPHHQADDDEEEDDDKRLPPAVFRLEAPRAQSGLFAAFGTKIMATHHTRSCSSSPMFDVDTRALTFAPRQECRPNSHCNAYVEVGGELFFLDASGNFEALPPPPPPHTGVPVPPPPFDAPFPKFRHGWSWRGLPESPPLFHIVAHAVHPDERAIFFVMEDHSSRRGAKVATFSFDTGSSRWARHGRWRLPFQGRGFADGELDAWVGLPHDADAAGRVCACDFVAADAGGIGAHRRRPGGGAHRRHPRAGGRREQLLPRAVPLRRRPGRRRLEGSPAPAPTLPASRDHLLPQVRQGGRPESFETPP
ncbi:hypothetical protein ACP4OV_000180 [Aristida adscensionis]